MDPRLTRPGKARSRHGRQDRREKIRASTLDSPSQVKRQGRQSAREKRRKKRAQRRGKPLSPPQPQPIHLLQTPVSRLPSAVFPFQIITDIYWDLFHLLFLLSSFPLYLYPFPQSFFFPSPPPIFCRHLQSSTLLLFSLPLITYSSVVRIWFVQSFSPYVDENPRLLHQRETSLPRESNPPFFATLFYAIAVWNILYLRRLVFVVVLVALRAEQRAKSSL